MALAVALAVGSWVLLPTNVEALQSVEALQALPHAACEIAIVSLKTRISGLLSSHRCEQAALSLLLTE